MVGRKKLSDVELDDAVNPLSAHNALTTIIEDGEQFAGRTSFGIVVDSRAKVGSRPKPA